MQSESSIIRYSPPAAFGAVIARLSGTGVGLGVVMDVQNVLITFCNVLAGNRRTVLYDNDFEILEALSREALQSSSASSGRLYTE